MQKAIFSLLLILMKVGTLFHSIYISDTIDWKRYFYRKFGTDVILEKFMFNAVHPNVGLPSEKSS